MTSNISTHANVVRISRRTVLGGLALAPALAAFGFRGHAMAQDKGLITMVTDTAGIGDGNFNDLTWAGVQRAGDAFGYTYKYLESIDNNAYVPNLTEAAGNSVLVVAVGFNLHDALDEIAPQFPDVSFMIVDDVVEQDNVESFTFKENEGGFLGGVAAAMYSRSKKLGIVGGQQIPPVIRYEVGFTAGAQTVLGKDWTPAVNYVGSFSDPASGKSAATAQYNQGADIVFPIAGLTNNGVFDAAKSLNLPNSVIGVDADQTALGPEQQVFYIGKALDVAVYDAVKSLSDGSFAGGANNLGLKEGGTKLGDPANKLSPEIHAAIEGYRQAIINGDLQVPGDYDSLKAFEPKQVAPIAVPATPGAGAATPVS